MSTIEMHNLLYKSMFTKYYKIKGHLV